MNRVGEFHKISEKQFIKDWQNCFPDTDASAAKSAYELVRLPVRATAGSAGYDFFCPYDLVMEPGEERLILTGIRAEFLSDWVLTCCPRSGLGFRYRFQLNNTVGIIDSDYFDSDNEGHIMAKMINDTRDGKVLELKRGSAFMQGVFLPYGVTYSDSAVNKRNGGFGSTS